LKLTRHVALTSVVLAGALALTACGSDSNSTGTSSSSSGGSGSSSAASGTLNGEGSTAQQNSIEQAISTFGDANPNATVNYNPTGSGAGIQQFIAGQVDFAGSDSALSTVAVDGKVEADEAKQRCGGNPAWDLPMSIGPIAVAYNLPGVTKLILTPSVTAQIFQGTIKTWNDPAIAKINPGATLPSTAIKVFFRSDQSGTTQNFEKYLAGAAPKDYTATPSKSWSGKVGSGIAKSSGTSQGVKSTTGGITYVEWSYAKDDKLGIAEIDNGGGPVTLDADSAGKAIETATQAGTGNDLSLSLDYANKTAGVYPIVLATYEVVCSKGLPAAKTALLKSFLTSFASTSTQSGLVSIGYAPLPTSIQTKVLAAVNAIS
jgi:phosphate transport system substrate-binding protein